MKTSNKLLAIAWISLTALQTLPAATESASVLLQKGIYAEETAGDLDAAMQIYRRIVDEAKENKPLVAQAQYRLALCHLKQGQRDRAVELLTAIVREFPSDSSLTGPVRAKLLELGVETPEASPELLLQPNADRWQDLSPNGRYATFIEFWPDTGVVIQELASGQTWITDNPKGDPHSGTSPAFSPDGRRVAYLWWGAGGKPREVRIATVGQTNFMVVGHIEGSLSLRDWTPDGSHLLGVHVMGEFESAEMILVSVKDGTSRTVPLGYEAKEIEKIDIAKFTVDGRHIVYQGPKGIQAFDLERKQHRTLVAHPAWTKLVGRIPGTSTFLFAGERSGKMALYAFQVLDGKLRGEPWELMDLQDFKNREFLAADREGMVYYRVRHSSQTIHLASVDFATGKLIEPPRGLGWPVAGDKSSPVWSWDGKSLAWESQGGTLNIQEQTSLTHRGFTWAGKLRGPAVYPYRTWSPDGKGFLVLSYPVEGSPGIYSIHCETGAIAPIVTRHWSGGDGAWVGQPQFSTDGKSVIFFRRVFAEDAPYEMHNTRFTDHIMRRDLKSGDEVEIYEPKGMLNTFCAFAISPDETRLALVMMDTIDDHHIDVVNIATGKLQRLYECQVLGGGPLSSLNWTGDGEALVFLRYYTKGSGKDREVLSVNVHTGKATPIDLGMTGIRQVSLHPDGRQVVFAVREDKAEMFRRSLSSQLSLSK